ncbi:MAG: hypothetical protein JXP34_22245 [Planctomycetes bacterium]|nr:hypothetical protein [Planctomycetota bacterium]
MIHSILAFFALASAATAASEPYAVVADHGCSSLVGEPPAETVVLSSAGSTLVVTHRWVTYNCGLILGIGVEVDGSDITLRERQLGDDMFCVCPFAELRYEVHGLAAGTYGIGVVKVGEGRPFWSGKATLRDDTIESAAGSREQLSSDPDAKESIEIVADGRAVLVDWRNVLVQCCLDLLAEPVLDGDRLTIRAEDVGPPCDCVSRRDLWILTGDLPPGRYDIVFIDIFGRETTERIEITEAPPGAFIRGEVNGDGRIDLGDAVYSLLYLFASGSAPPCIEAADIDDNAVLDLGDPVGLLNYLFASGPAPAPPFPDPGPDPTPDGLGCVAVQAR